MDWIRLVVGIVHEFIDSVTGFIKTSISLGGYINEEITEDNLFQIASRIYRDDVLFRLLDE